VRFRTAAILSAVLVGGGMVIFPAFVRAVLIPSLQDPIPGYEIVILRVYMLCTMWRWVLAPLTVLVLFLIAALTSESAHKQSTALPRARRVR